MQFSASDTSVGSEQIKHVGQAMHEPGVPVVCWRDTSVAQQHMWRPSSLGYTLHWQGEYTVVSMPWCITLKVGQY